jgi:hypothetical protein
MTKQLTALMTLAACLSLGAPARAAHTPTFIANLTGAQETPPNDSGSLGLALLTLNKDNRLCYAISFSRLDAVETVAHIHGPAAPGVAADPLFTITPSGSPKNGCAGPLTARDKKNLKKGLLYLNIHSNKFLAGEVRGQIIPAGTIRN